VFVDRVQIEAVAGDGGRGMRSFRREKYVPLGGPDGGDGGSGGSVILEARAGVDSLAALAHRRQWKADSGEAGGPANCQGRNAHDLVLLVRSRIAPRVEDVLPGSQFSRAHAYLTAAAIVDGTSSAGADRSDLATYYRARAVESIDQVLALVDWADLDGDGVVDTGETAIGAATGRATAGIGSTLTDLSVVRYETDPSAPYEVTRTRVTDDR
jgi:hypothetical protein